MAIDELGLNWRGQTDAEGHVSGGIAATPERQRGNTKGHRYIGIGAGKGQEGVTPALPCREECGESGFYAVLSGCTSGHVYPQWRGGEEASGEEASGDEAGGEKDIVGTVPGDMEDGVSDRETCNDAPQLFQLHRMLIYARNYSRRRGDDVPAVMMSRLATEPEPRWLRSDMLASGVFAWDLLEQMGVNRSRAVTVGFTVKGKHQSTSVDRTIPLEVHPLLPRPLDLRPADRRRSQPEQ